MRVAMVAAAFAALWVQPAAAQTFQFQVQGSLTFTELTSQMAPVSNPPECIGQVVVCNTTRTYQQDYVATLFGTSTDGINWTFDQYFLGPRERVYGTAQYLGNGAYQGLNLRVDGYQTLSGPVGHREWTASTSQFQFLQVFPQPVPEPATWALMIVGFGAVGGAMRRRQTNRGSYSILA